jgi:hypothetical protein
MLTHKPRARGRSHLLGLATALGITLTLLIGAGPATAARTHVQSADAALARAGTNIQAQHYARAVHSLKAVGRHTRLANLQATRLIGAPPTDPESDDPPGPPAVLKALQLDNRITNGSVALFNNQTRPRVVRQLRSALNTALVQQDALLDAVIALPPEGAGSDYSDSMADTLTMYNRQVTTISNALATYTLSTSGTEGLNKALTKAKATKAKVNAAFGGGERTTNPAP